HEHQLRSRSAVRLVRAQRRDQHHRTPARRSEGAAHPALAFRQRLAGRRRGAAGHGPRHAPHTDRGDRAALPADRQRDQAHARGAAGPVHPGARGVRSVRAGTGRVPLARRRHVSLRRRRARSASAMARRDAGRARLRERARIRPARAIRPRSVSARARRARRSAAHERGVALSRPGRAAARVRRGPHAALSAARPNLADYLHETVAVVTNPAIDREREIEHFSTRALLGPRPLPRAASTRGRDRGRWIELRMPILLGGHAPETGLRGDDHRALARKLGTWIVEDVVVQFTADGARVPVILEADRDWEEHPRDALARLGAQACRGVRGGATLVVVQDRHVVDEGRAWLDPLLVVAAAHRALITQPSRNGSLRRECAIVVSAGSLRNLHDLMVALALGADAVNPYLLLEYALSLGDPDALPNLVEALRKGMEKVISTLGVHEIRGYGRQLSAIGVAPEVARMLGIATFCASDASGLSWDRIGADGFDRGAMLRERRPARIEPVFRLYPRVWKVAGAVANGEQPYRAFADKLE